MYCIFYVNISFLISDCVSCCVFCYRNKTAETLLNKMAMFCFAYIILVFNTERVKSY